MEGVDMNSREQFLKKQIVNLTERLILARANLERLRTFSNDAARTAFEMSLKIIKENAVHGTGCKPEACACEVNTIIEAIQKEAGIENVEKIPG